jgi:hypothetical protein
MCLIEQISSGSPRTQVAIASIVLSSLNVTTCLGLIVSAAQEVQGSLVQLLDDVAQLVIIGATVREIGTIGFTECAY